MIVNKYIVGVWEDLLFVWFVFFSFHFSYSQERLFFDACEYGGHEYAEDAAP